jgi:hypothetical protein
MNEYAVGRASADLRDAILKCMGLDVPIRMHGPKPRQRPKVVKPPPRQTYRVERCNRVEGIQRAVAEFYSLTFEQITGKRGSAYVSDARQIAMYLCRELTGHSFPRLGWMFSRDHTTVMHACSEVARRRQSDANYAAEIQKLQAALFPLAMAA